MSETTVLKFCSKGSTGNDLESQTLFYNIEKKTEICEPGFAEHPWYLFN